MKILIATDSFKDALPALNVGQIIAYGIKMADSSILTQVFPLADGGEGTADILHHHVGGEWINLTVHDPLFRPIQAKYLLADNGKKAFIEMAAASGLPLLSLDERKADQTTTFGTGEMILDAYNKGVRHIILTIGGSATNDAGMGMATALGYRFLDKFGETLRPIGANMIKVKQIEVDHLKIGLYDLKMEVICDVDNPLYGPNGAAYTYAAQKGAGAEDIVALEQGARHFATMIYNELGEDVAGIKGAGAAGGLGAGAIAFLNAQLQAGANLVMEYTNFEKALDGVDLIITGEGKIDGQTLHGKLIHGVCQRASAKNIPVIALCGSLQANPDQIKAIGLAAAYSILNGPMELGEAILKTKVGLEQMSFNLIRTLNIMAKR